MRIISGTYKGQKILEPKDKKTRPLKDLTKESIFNIINHSKKFQIDFPNSIVLDLFSGVGSFGIECLSRGARKVTFIENYQGVIPILKENLSNLKSIKNYEIIEQDIYKENIFSKFKVKFDLIFLDPPYKDMNSNKLLKEIKKNIILSQNGIIILHRHKSEKDDFTSSYRLIEQRIYGISKIIFLSNLD